MPTNDAVLVALQRDLYEMRKVYVSGPLKGRLNIAIMRLTDHHFGPNRLVTAVSAVEAIARSIVVHDVAKKKRQTMMKSYMEYKNYSPQDLVEKALRIHGHLSVEKVFGIREWKVFGYAVEFRHLLVHECTYLSLDKFQILIDSCGMVLQKLVEGSRLSLRRKTFGTL